MIGQPCISCIYSKKQARYQPVTNCTSWPVLVSYKNWNIIHLSHKSTHLYAFKEIHKFGIDRISDNMVSLGQSDKYASVNTSVTTTNGYYVIMFISEAYTLKNNTTTDVQIIYLGELVFKTQYICSIKYSTNWYWGKHPL